MKFVLATLLVFGFVSMGHAEESLGEKAKATTDSAKRGLKKGYNRTKEAACGTLTGDNKVQCLAKKAKNRTEEGVDAVKDKASEVKNSVDSE